MGTVFINFRYIKKGMLTIFSITRPFWGHFNTIQRNAIASWVRLRPDVEVVLIGDEQGERQIAEELNLKHHPEIKRDKFGFAYMRDIIKIGADSAGSPLICYLNADIILLADFIESIRKAREYLGNNDFFISGRRRNVDVDYLIDYGNPQYEKEIKALLKNRGRLEIASAIDYFVFPRYIAGRIIDIMPDFVVGVTPWDNWFLYMMHKLNLPFVNATHDITAIHQNHEHFRPEVIENDTLVPDFRIDPYQKRLYSLKKRKLCSFRSKLYSLYDATHILRRGKVYRVTSKRRLLALKAKVVSGIWYIFTDIFYPYSEPLVRIIKKIVNKL